MARGTALLFDLVARDGASATFLRVAGAADKTAAATSRAEKSMGFFGTGVAKSAAKLGVAFGAFELAKKAIDITKEANDFHRAMVQVQTTANVSAAEVNKASAALLKMAGPVAASPKELAVAWYHAKAVGLDYAKSIETTKIAAEGARVGHADLEETMNALTSTVASGIPGVKDMSSAMGQLIGIVGTGDMKLSDLNSALGSGILTVVKGYGLSLTDVGAALATFGDNNIRGAHAATMLRMAVQAMAVPAKAGAGLLNELGLTSEGSAAALEKVHLSTGTLAKDMQTGGLNKAILDLKKHLDDAGVTGVQTGQVLTEMFGKRAGPGIGVLIGQVDRLESKFAILRDSGAGFDAKWKATTQTASFALSSLGHSLESAGISATTALGPAIAHTATLLTGVFRSAVSTAGSAVAPFIAGWHQVSGVLGSAGSAMGTLLRALAPIKPALVGIGTTVLTMWAVFKGYAIVVGAFKAIQTAIVLTRVRLLELRAGAMAAATGMNLALGGIGLAIGAIAMAWQENKADAAAWSAAVKSDADGITGTLNKVTGAITDSTTAMLNQKLAASDTFGKFAKYGVAAQTVTDAAMGNTKAMAALQKVAYDTIGINGEMLKVALMPVQQLAQGTKLAQKGIHQVGEAERITAAETGKHATAVAADTRVLQYNIDAHGTLFSSMQKAGSALDNTSAAMSRQTVASGLLKSAIDILNGVNVSVEQAQDAMTISLGNLANKSTLFKDANNNVSKSLNQSTVAGATNRQMLVGIIEQAKTAAQAVADHARQQGKSLPEALRIGNAALATNEDKIRKAAHAAGLSDGAVNTLIGSMGKLAKIKAEPKVLPPNTKPAKATLADLQTRLNSLKQSRNPEIGVHTAAGRAQVAELQRQIDALRSKTIDITVNQSVGRTVHDAVNGIPKASGGHITGPGSGTSDSIPARLSNGEFVVRASQTKKHLPLLNAINSGVRGYAHGGVVGGIRYTTDLGYHNAQARAAAAAKKKKDTSSSNAVSSSISNIGQSYSPPFSVADVGIGRVRSTIQAATQVLKAQMDKGMSAKTAAGFAAQIKSLTKTANAQLANLRVKIKGSDLAAMRAGLKGTVEDTSAALQQMYTDFSKAGGSASGLSKLRSKGSALLSAQSKLGAAKDYRSSVADTLRGGFDPTQYGSVGDLLTGLGNATGSNKQYASEADKLRKAGLNSGLLNTLLASGQNATLESLAGASKADIAQVNKAYGGYNASVAAGSDSAELAKFGKSVDSLAAAQAEIAAAVAALASSLGSSMLDSKTDARIQDALAKITAAARHGRK